MYKHSGLDYLIYGFILAGVHVLEGTTEVHWGIGIALAN